MLLLLLAGLGAHGGNVERVCWAWLSGGWGWRGAVRLQGVLSEEFKAGEIEVGVVRDGHLDRAFHVLSNDEVESFLVAISERD